MQKSLQPLKIALIIDNKKTLFGILNDKSEISFAENLIKDKNIMAKDCILQLERLRNNTSEQQEQLANYLSSLLLEDAVGYEIKQQALQWLDARREFDNLRHYHIDFAHLMGQFAYQKFLTHPHEKSITLQQSHHPIVATILSFL